LDQGRAEIEVSHHSNQDAARTSEHQQAILFALPAKVSELKQGIGRQIGYETGCAYRQHGDIKMGHWIGLG